MTCNPIMTDKTILLLGIMYMAIGAWLIVIPPDELSVQIGLLVFSAGIAGVIFACYDLGRIRRQVQRRW